MRYRLFSSWWTFNTWRTMISYNCLTRFSSGPWWCNYFLSSNRATCFRSGEYRYTYKNRNFIMSTQKLADVIKPVPEGLMGDVTGLGILDLCTGEVGVPSSSLLLSISHFCCSLRNLLPFKGLLSWSAEKFESRDSGPVSTSCTNVASCSSLLPLPRVAVVGRCEVFSRLSVYSSSSSRANLE